MTCVRAPRRCRYCDQILATRQATAPANPARSTCSRVARGRGSSRHTSRRRIPVRETCSAGGWRCRPMARPWRSAPLARTARRRASMAIRPTTPQQMPARSTCSRAVARRGASRPTSRRRRPSRARTSAGVLRCLPVARPSRWGYQGVQHRRRRWLRRVRRPLGGRLGAVGAKYESSAATGVNGDQGNNAALQAGAVYVFP